ncbi:MAG: long-chain fatty acid--CoA ligase [Gammaproteobacteria bacterium]
MEQQVPEITMPEGTITVEAAGTLAGLFRERVRRTPDAVAYRYYDYAHDIWKDSSWREMAREVARWQAAIEQESLDKGDRVAIMMRNSREWVMLDQAAFGLGLVVVPLYIVDRADNVEFILRDAGVKMLIIGGPERWQQIKEKVHDFDTVKRIVYVRDIKDESDSRLIVLDNWLPADGGDLRTNDSQPDELATIVYTSGTTGQPKGVMLSHKNILCDAHSGLRTVVIRPDAVFLSILPLSHTLERTIGSYLPMMAGATVAYARSIDKLTEDLLTIKPVVIISVPRIFERAYVRIKQELNDKPRILTRLFDLAIEIGEQRFEHLQGRGRWHASFILWPLLKYLVAEKITRRFGGCLEIVISGGAPLPPKVSRAFIGLGIPILQGYGLTEASPVVSVNRLDNNIPESIGPALPEVNIMIGANDELLVKGNLVMLGYWNNPQATRESIDDKGWLHTGDQACIKGQHIYITGRLKDIIVMSNGEKVPPEDMELAIKRDILFEQIMIIGDSRPYLSALVVLNGELWSRFVSRNNLGNVAITDEKVENLLLERIARQLKQFPGYARIKCVMCLDEYWTIDNDLLTPTLKIKRNKIRERYTDKIEQMYEGHTI